MLATRVSKATLKYSSLSRATEGAPQIKHAMLDPAQAGPDM